MGVIYRPSNNNYDKFQDSLLTQSQRKLTMKTKCVT